MVGGICTCERESSVHSKFRACQASAIGFYCYGVCGLLCSPHMQVQVVLDNGV